MFHGILYACRRTSEKLKDPNWVAAVAVARKPTKPGRHVQTSVGNGKKGRKEGLGIVSAEAGRLSAVELLSLDARKQRSNPIHFRLTHAGANNGIKTAVIIYT
jgi:hypothetical protein